MKKKKPNSLFQRLINNQISKEEFEKLLQSMDDEKARQLHELYLKEHFDDILKNYENTSEFNSDNKETEINNQGKIKAFSKIKFLNFFGNNTPYIKVAAAIFVIAISIITFWAIFLPQETDTSTVDISLQKDVPVFVEKSTPRGSMETFELNDGSKAQLNVDSKITYPENFALENRQVSLSGQAYFDVKPDKNLPFIINAHDLTVEVVGTSFDIKAYENEDKVSITVESGRVKVHIGEVDEAPVVLTKNQKLIFNSLTSSIELTEVDSSDEMAWRYGTLRFQKTPVAEVEQMLERWYNVEINIADTAIYQHKITGVHKNESLISVLKTLNYVLDISYTIENNNVTLKKIN